jgi:hypothetical protein
MKAFAHKNRFLGSMHGRVELALLRASDEHNASGKRTHGGKGSCSGMFWLDPRCSTALLAPNLAWCLT